MSCYSIALPQAEEIVEEKTGKSVLDKFCRWINYEQQLRFPNEQSHDLAVYITRQDIGPAGTCLSLPCTLQICRYISMVTLYFIYRYLSMVTLYFIYRYVSIHFHLICDDTHLN